MAISQEIIEKNSNMVVIRMHRRAEYISSSPAPGPATHHSPLLKGESPAATSRNQFNKRSIHDPGLQEETKIDAYNCVKPF